MRRKDRELMPEEAWEIVDRINTKTKVNLLNSKILHTLDKQVGELVEH